MQTFFNAILYATTPEFVSLLSIRRDAHSVDAEFTCAVSQQFPAYVRGSACGLASTLGRLSGVSRVDLLFDGTNRLIALLDLPRSSDRRAVRRPGPLGQGQQRCALACRRRYLAFDAGLDLLADRDQAQAVLLD
jgi:hypothetical protein